MIAAKSASRLSAVAEHHGAGSADRARSALSALFAWCVTQGIADSNPVIGTTKYAEPSSRDRVLSESELAAVWNALPDNDYGSVVKLLILTGCRADEIAWLRWSEIDIDGRKISLPGERTKNKRPFIVPLASTVVDILKGIPRPHDRDLVFGKGAGGFQGWSKCKAELDAKLKIPDWTVHDIRRTVVNPHGRGTRQRPAAHHRGGAEPRQRAQGRNCRHLQQGDLLAGEAARTRHLGAPHRRDPGTGRWRQCHQSTTSMNWGMVRC